MNRTIEMEAEKEVQRRIWPYLRSGVALLILLAGRRVSIVDSYTTSDQFLTYLAADLDRERAKRAS